MILYRIEPSLALKQATDLRRAARCCSALTILFLRDYTELERYRYLIAIAGMPCSSRRAFRAWAARSTAPTSQINAGPLSFQPAEVAKICIVIFLASYLHEHRELLSVGAKRVAGSRSRRSSTSARCSWSGARRW